MITRQHRESLIAKLDEIEYHAERLTKWEENFCESLRHQLESTGSLSERQEEILDKIHLEKS